MLLLKSIMTLSNTAKVARLFKLPILAENKVSLLPSLKVMYTESKLACTLVFARTAAGLKIETEILH